MDLKPGYPDGLLFIGHDSLGAPVFFTDERAATEWMAVSPDARRMWRAELCEQTAMEFVPPGSPSIRPKER